MGWGTLVDVRRARVVVQVRSDSQRFPNKAFVPVAGIPSAALAALRARNRGIEVVVATTTRELDDALTFMLESYGLEVMRGPDADVRQRYLEATRDLGDEATVVRLTADNVFPDGEFVARLVEAFEMSGGAYLGTTSAAKLLPFGLGAEAFRLGALRAIAREVDDPFDREHVTPSLRERFAAGGLDVTLRPLPDAGHLRCTLDTVEDYLRLVRVFDGVADPETVGWRALLDRLVEIDV
jgi:spore coat polysaccharide biosynthesis protein SpsF (cytidylyltransferase family)